MDHRAIDLRSIALHRAVANKISADPSLVKVVFRWIDEQLGQGLAHSASTSALLVFPERGIVLLKSLNENIANRGPAFPKALVSLAN